MTKIINHKETLKDLKNYNIKRLFVSQKLYLEELSELIYDSNRNDMFQCLQNIFIINKEINKRLDKVKK